jgi:hypothetical protein
MSTAHVRTKFHIPASCFILPSFFVISYFLHESLLLISLSAVLSIKCLRPASLSETDMEPVPQTVVLSNFQYYQPADMK